MHMSFETTDAPSQIEQLREEIGYLQETLTHERRTIAAQIAEAQEDERRRVAAELHDEVGQGLTALLLQLHSLVLDAPVQLNARLMEAHELARKTLDEVRRIARQLPPAVLDDLGLAYALVHLCDVMRRSTDLSLVPDVDEEAPRLEPPVELALYRIAQEALTNVARHAEAAEAAVVFRVQDGRALLQVTDDGIGVDPLMAESGGGLAGMRYRAASIGASLEVRSVPQGGTVITVVTGEPS